MYRTITAYHRDDPWEPIEQEHIDDHVGGDDLFTVDALGNIYRERPGK